VCPKSLNSIDGTHNPLGVKEGVPINISYMFVQSIFYKFPTIILYQSSHKMIKTNEKIHQKLEFFLSKSEIWLD
jgi:hypothetical protein